MLCLKTRSLLSRTGWSCMKDVFEQVLYASAPLDLLPGSIKVEEVLSRSKNGLAIAVAALSGSCLLGGILTIWRARRRGRVEGRA